MKIYLLACLASLALLHAVPGQCQEAIFTPDGDVEKSDDIRDEEIIDIDDDEEIDVGRMLVALLAPSEEEDENEDSNEDEDEIADDSDREARQTDLLEVTENSVMTQKYNRFVDVVLSRMSMMMRLHNDPMKLVIRNSGKVFLESDERLKKRNKKRKQENKNKEEISKSRNKSTGKGRKNSNRKRGNRGTTRRRHPKDLILDVPGVDSGAEDETEEIDEDMEDESEDGPELMADSTAEIEDDVDEEDEERNLGPSEENELEIRKKREIAADVIDDEDYYDYDLEYDEDDYDLEGREFDYAEDAEYDDEYYDEEYNEIEPSDELRNARELEEQETSDVVVVEESNSGPGVTGRNRRRRRQQAAARRRRRRKGGKRKGKCGKRCRRKKKAMRRRIRRRNKTKKKKKRRRGKRSVRRNSRESTAVLTGVSKLSRNGDVQITERKGSQNIAANFDIGPIELKAERKMRGPNQEVLKGEAQATNVKGEIVINVNKNGKASVRKLRIFRPDSIQVSGSLRTNLSKSPNLQAYVSRTRPIIVNKMKAIAAQILDASNISDSQVEKMKRSVA